MATKTLKPIPFYFITTSDMNELTYEKAYEALSELKHRGFGGAVLFNKPPHGFNADEYLSDNWFIMIENFIKAAKELELEIWLNDGFDYPPGGAAGRIEKIDPSLKQMRIKRENGRFVTEEVDWGFPAFEYEKSSDLFIELVYGEYKKRIGKYFGNVVRGIFSDADNRRINSSITTSDDPTSSYYFPWSKDFEETFCKKFGYDIFPHLSEIFEFCDTQAAADYWQHCSDLYVNWFKKNYEWCKKNNLEYTFHTSDTSPFSLKTAVRSSIFTEGRFSDVEVNSDYSGTDQELLELNGGKHYIKDIFYVPQISWGDKEDARKSEKYYDLLGDVRTKQAQSTAFVNDKKGTMCEMFAATNWGADYNELREIASFQIMHGVTFIVPHAYHHRLLGETKYFAPPDFSDRGHLAHVDLLNEKLVEYLSYSSRGTLDAPIAVMDITDDVWRAKGKTDLFLAVCDELNRKPFGYVIADKKGIEKKKDSFSLIINTTSEKLDSFCGIKIANISDISELDSALSDLVPAVTYIGEGSPYYMVLKTESGPCALIANIENKGEINGTVNFGGKSYDVCLASGEIAIFTEKEQIYRKPVEVVDTAELPSNAEVVWGNENLIPIGRWLSNDGKAILQQDNAPSISFEFDVKTGAENLKFYVPASCASKITDIKGVDLNSKILTKYFDDDYWCYNIDVKTGKNVITVEKNAPIPYYERFFISGEFDVDIKTENPLYKHSFYIYNMNAFIPEKAEITLSKRRTVLDMKKSAALQGHPFYFGSVTYKVTANVPESFDNYRLNIKNATFGVSVKVDDGEYENLIFKPYVLPIGKKGTIKLELKTCSSLANFLEMYQREFGITDGIYLEKLK